MGIHPTKKYSLEFYCLISIVNINISRCINKILQLMSSIMLANKDLSLELRRAKISKA